MTILNVMRFLMCVTHIIYIRIVYTVEVEQIVRKMTCFGIIRRILNELN